MPSRHNFEKKIAMNFTILASKIISLLLLFIAINSYAVTLPRCNAPPYSGQDSIQSLDNKLALAFHLTMMINESDNGKVAYCITRSGMVESGLSYGVSQLDLRTNNRAWPILLNILQKVGQEDKSLAFSEEELNYIQLQLVGLKAPRAIDILKKDDPKLDVILEKVSVALKNESAQLIINNIHKEHIQKALEFISNTQNNLNTSSIGASNLLETSLFAKLLIMDYWNLFGSINEKLMPYMVTGKVALNSGQINISGKSLSVSDIMQFILKTKQGSGCKANERAELLRRMGYVLVNARANGDKTHWTIEDRNFFSKTLPSILDEPCVSHQVDLGHLRKFTQIAL